MSDSATYCPVCGAANAPSAAPPAYNPGSQYQYPVGQTATVGSLPPAVVAEGDSNGTVSLTLGILSIVLCWATGVLGVIFGILAIVKGRKARTLLNDQYYSYYSSLASIITGAIGIFFSFIFVIVYLAAIAAS